jgi:hypothetical protein
MEESEKAREAERRHTEEANRQAEAYQERLEERQRLERRMNEGLDHRIRLLQAGSEWDRRRLEAQREYAELLEKAAGNEEIIAKAKALYGEQLADILEDQAQAQAALTKLAQEEQAAREKAVADMTRMWDVTKRFRSLPGTGGIFGFGAGIVGGTGFHDPGTRRTRSPMAAPPKAPAGPAVPGVPELPDVAPNLDAATAAIGRATENFKRLADAAVRLGQAAVDGDRKIGDATVKAVAEVDKKAAEARRIAKEVERRLAKISGPGGPV